MFASSAFLLSWCAVFIMTGAALYIVDRAFGRRVYRWWYDLAHEQPLDHGIDVGFLYGRRSHHRFTAAVVLTMGQGALAIVHGVSSLPVEVLSMLVELPCLMTGFYLGPALDRFWLRREQVFEKVDRLEREGIHVPAATPERGEPGTIEPEPAEELDPQVFMSRYLTRQ